MSNDLCSALHCNICLVLKNQHQNASQLPPPSPPSLPQLLTCSGCRLVKYCNRQHQKLDWTLHRDFCQAVQKIKHSLNVSHPFHLAAVPKSKEDLERATVQLKYLLRNTLSRSLEYQEEELTSYPAHCGQCFKVKSLKVVCQQCLSQAYCSQEHKELHREQHVKVCGLLKIYYCPYKVQPLTQDLDLKFKSRVNDLHKLDLVETFQQVFSLQLPADPCASLANYQLFAQASDFSCITSICYVMQQLNVLDINLERYSIFLLGASVEAILWFREIHCKLFFIQNPHIKELVLDFIGPEVVEPDYKELKFIFLGSTRLVKFYTYKGLFQDYCKHYHVKPSLMMAFNCGFSEFSQSYNLTPTITDLNSLEPLLETGNETSAKDTWFEGLIEILQTFDTPIVFTSFTEQESQFDFAALQNAAVKQPLKVHIERIFKAVKNPFHDLRPLRQWYTRDKEEFYYRNGYIQGIHTRLEH